MRHPDRREFLRCSAALAGSVLLPGAGRAALGPDEKYDLLLRNADVLDPSQGLRGRRDIAMRFGRIAAVAPSVAPDSAQRVMDAGGKLVTPGLIDLHAHTYPFGSGIGIPADELVAHQCTTTVVSAGDAGANNIAAWRRFIVPGGRTRQYAFVHIALAGLAGFPVPELYNIDYAQVDATARAVAENADIVLGVKVRMSENVIARHGAEPLRRAIAACERSGVAGVKVMMHIGGVSDRALMSTLLDMLRPGDILTHCYSGAPNNAGDGTNIVQDGKLLPAALAAKQRGVVFDIGHGGGSFDYTIAEAAIAQGCVMDTISSDVHVYSANTPGMPYLPWVMSKFLAMGHSLEQVVAMVTQVPARVIGREPKLGTLQLGAPADLSLLEVVEGPVGFVDSRNNRRDGKVHLRPAGNIVSGVAFGRPYQAPFSVH
ncbi:amidohydrolase family protein [Pseudacidovorax sp. RU35E]|uniref:amidohydrolase family protein n=1 Tax=Pseudacidovorax sp. RU35E TaxID=1907403 RepID=UPI000955916D|nr:amidohydrolase/deacetylase family metallohydrolase [Pseudacidovorax sp. RU35E]SIR47226.1 dihydroorotase [Pseudacidovorax sp. RU35E]